MTSIHGTPTTALDGYTAATSFESNAIPFTNAIGCSITADFEGGSPTGTLVVQGSNDVSSPAVWFTITKPVDTTTTVSGAGTYVWNLSNQFAAWLRVQYTASGGTSTVTIKATVKG